MNTLRSWIIAGVLSVVPAGAGLAGTGDPFATEVVAFAPAPGQFALNGFFNDPFRALGPPVGGGTFAPGNSSLVSLGGFGGSITLRFAVTVADDALNPMGLDAIVFGNAHWVGGPEHHWGECGVIEISRDENDNGLADDRWYLIPGSHLSWPLAPRAIQMWDDDPFSDTYPPTDPAWIPEGAFGTWATSGYLLPALFATNKITNPLMGTGNEGIFGYADYTPTLVRGDTNGDNVIDAPQMAPAEFYTVPDDPMVLGISPGSGGGDAFDIAWAIDPATGEPAGLSGFDFIRISSGVNHVLPFLGEVSTEVDAVADVRPDAIGDYDADGDIDLADAAGLQRCVAGVEPGGEGCSRLDRDQDETVTLAEAGNILMRMTDPW